MENFYDVVNRLCDLYISYRGRYVMMLPQAGKIFMPKTSSGPAKLTNRAVCQHVNRQIAIGVFAGAHASKFICFDVDLPDPSEVRWLMDAMVFYGVPRDLIYVSTSGGKGYHVEIFFDRLVYTDRLRTFFDCVVLKAESDPFKVEFRPTNGLSIKLPLSVHCKTGRVCWYLDRDTLQPIEDPAYILQIQQMAVADFAAVLEQLPRARPLDREDVCFDEQEPVPALKMKRADLDRLEGDGYPDLLEPGHRHNTMLAIGIHNRYRGLGQERNREELLAWAARQPGGLPASVAGGLGARDGRHHALGLRRAVCGGVTRERETDRVHRRRYRLLGGAAESYLPEVHVPAAVEAETACYLPDEL